LLICQNAEGVHGLRKVVNSCIRASECSSGVVIAKRAFALKPC